DANLIARGRHVSAELQAHDVAVTATGEVGIDPGGAVMVHSRWEPAEVGDLARRIGWSPPFPLSGSTSLGVDLAGTRDDVKSLQVTANIDRLSVDADNQRVELVQPARFEYDGRVARVRDFSLTTGGSTLTIGGSLGEPASPGLTARLHGSLADLGFIQRTIQSALRNRGPHGADLAPRGGSPQPGPPRRGLGAVGWESA